MSTPPAITTALHRVRFADYHPSPITAISFTPIPFPSPDPEIAEKKAQQDALSKKEEMAALVVARQNGEVQIWEYATNEAREEVGSWVLRRVCRGRYSQLGTKKLTSLISS
jgi:U3 small nucleolar RNA-associated protein 4